MVGLRSTVSECKQWLSERLAEGDAACPVCNRNVERFRLPAPLAPEFPASPEALEAADVEVEEWAVYGMLVWKNRERLFR